MRKLTSVLSVCSRVLNIYTFCTDQICVNRLTQRESVILVTASECVFDIHIILVDFWEYIMFFDGFKAAAMT